MSYQLLCQCGRTLTGDRQRRHQVVSCPDCSRAIFVLPSSVFAPRAETAAASRPRRWWRWPLLAGIGCFLLLLIGFALLRPYLVRKGDGQEKPFDPKEKIALGRRQLGQGKFKLAHKTLDEVVKHPRTPDALSPADVRELNQLHRQADLLARCLVVELYEVAALALRTRDPEEWALRFDGDFKGRSVVFDSPVGRNKQGRPALLNWQVEAPDDERVRVAIEELELLRDLPLDDRPRLIFGARLAACEREPGGDLVIRLRPDSGVLLTDLDATRAIWLGTAPDKELEQILARQQKWLDDRGPVLPAPP